MRPLILLACLALGACANAGATPIPPSKLNPPAARLMEPPNSLPDVAESDSLYEHAAMCRAEYGRLSTKVQGLQRWATIVTRNK
jgi:hypothetical protein